jgi:hypothetical protein
MRESWQENKRSIEIGGMFSMWKEEKNVTGRPHGIGVW